MQDTIGELIMDQSSVATVHIDRLLYYRKFLFSVLELDVRYDWRVMAPNTHCSLFTTRGINFLVKINYTWGWACKKYRNRVGMKTQEDYPATEKSWRKKTGRLLYICCIVRQQKSSIVFQSFFSTTFL